MSETRSHRSRARENASDTTSCATSELPAATVIAPTAQRVFPSIPALEVEFSSPRRGHHLHEVTAPLFALGPETTQGRAMRRRRQAGLGPPWPMYVSATSMADSAISIDGPSESTSVASEMEPSPEALTCGNRVELMGLEPTTSCLQSGQGPLHPPWSEHESPGQDVDQVPARTVP